MGGLAGPDMDPRFVDACLEMGFLARPAVTFTGPPYPCFTVVPEMGPHFVESPFSDPLDPRFKAVVLAIPDTPARFVESPFKDPLDPCFEAVVLVVPEIDPRFVESPFCDPPDPCFEMVVLDIPDTDPHFVEWSFNDPSRDLCFESVVFAALEGGRLFKVLPFCSASIDRCFTTGFFDPPTLDFG